jgi:ADP-heptose:LPS heptosyltransferase
MKILFIPNGIGDVLMALPLLRRMVSAEGEREIAVVVASQIHGDIIKKLTGYELLTFVRFDGRRYSHLRLYFSLLFTRAEIIYAPLLSRKLKNIVFFFFLFKQVWVPANSTPWSFLNIRRSELSLFGYGGHQVDYFVRFVGMQMPTLDRTSVLFDELRPKGLVVSALERPVEFPKKIAVGLSCGTQERHKIPSPEFFGRLLNALADNNNFEFFIIGSRIDQPLIAAMRAILNPQIQISEAIDIPLDVLMIQLSTCDLGISGTTGQGHMMAAAGLPMLVLAGVTNPQSSGPYAERVAVLRHRLACGPCYQENFRFGCGQLKCMDTLDITSAAQMAIQLIENKEFGRGWCQKTGALMAVPIEMIENLHQRPQAEWENMKRG